MRERINKLKKKAVVNSRALKKKSSNSSRNDDKEMMKKLRVVLRKYFPDGNRRSLKSLFQYLRIEEGKLKIAEEHREAPGLNARVLDWPIFYMLFNTSQFEAVLSANYGYISKNNPIGAADHNAYLKFRQSNLDKKITTAMIENPEKIQGTLVTSQGMRR